MAVWSEVKVSEATQAGRFSAEFFDPKYLFNPNDMVRYTRLVVVTHHKAHHPCR